MKHKDRGAAAVEFALVLVPLSLVLFGMVVFGTALYAQISIDHVAREGVRIAALGDDPMSDGAWTTDVLGPVKPANVSVTPCPAPLTPTSSTRVVVTKQVDLTPLSAFVPGIPATITLTSTGVARCYK